MVDDSTLARLVTGRRHGTAPPLLRDELAVVGESATARSRCPGRRDPNPDPREVADPLAPLLALCGDLVEALNLPDERMAFLLPEDVLPGLISAWGHRVIRAPVPAPMLGLAAQGEFRSMW